MIKFIITGLPRSGTSWLSVFLTTDDCVCLHDPCGKYSLDVLEKWSGGISDSGAWLDEDWCKKNTDKFIVIDRKREEVKESLNCVSLSTLPEYLYDRFYFVSGNKKIYFENLFDEEIARELWEYIYPEKSFPFIRWNELKDMYISPKYIEERRQ